MTDHRLRDAKTLVRVSGLRPRSLRWWLASKLLGLATVEVIATGEVLQLMADTRARVADRQGEVRRHVEEVRASIRQGGRGIRRGCADPRG